MTNKNRKLKVLAFGEILFDVINDEEYMGGAALNFAANIARFNVQSSMLSAIGYDERGELVIKRLADYGVGYEYVIRCREFPTGIVDVKLASDGQPSYDIKKNAAYDNIDYTSQQISQILESGWDAFYFGTLAQRNEVSRKCLYRMLDQYNDGLVFCDINLRQDYYSSQIIEKSLGYADIVKINDEEQVVLSSLLYGESISSCEFYDRLVENYGVKLLVVTAGSQGCDLFDSDGLTHVDGVNVDVVDTVGAGDAFSAAFLHSYLVGMELKQAGLVANCLGAYIAANRGATPDYDLEDIFVACD